jgi:chromosome segregation ATPase
MSEQEGLAKLAAYLQQTRKQAELSIDILNTRILSLENESEAISSERDYFRNYSEQLKLENSKKWRLHERDDWKSLVESVQVDRARLQESCDNLEIELEEARAGVKILEEEINLMKNERYYLMINIILIIFKRYGLHLQACKMLNLSSNLIIVAWLIY